LLIHTFNIKDLEAKNYINNFIKRFITQQFKRQASPDGPKVLDISLNPRTDLRMPSDLDFDGTID
jgi:NAD+ synthase (glutamine-hydrolysing)